MSIEKLYVTKPQWKRGKEIARGSGKYQIVRDVTKEGDAWVYWVSEPGIRNYVKYLFKRYVRR